MKDTSLTALSSPSTAAWGQEQIAIAPGQRVRVTAPELGVDRQVAEFEALDGGLLTLKADSTLQYPLSAVTRLELYAGQRSHFWRGVGTGFVGGYAVGFLTWVVAIGYCYPGASTLSCAAVLGGGMGAIAGTFIGALVGLAVRTDKWEEVSLDGVRLQIMTSQDGLGIAVSVRF